MMVRGLLIAGLLAAAVCGAGCHKRPTTPGGATGSKPDAARKQAEGIALSVVNAAAEAQVRAVPSLAKKRGGDGGAIDQLWAAAYLLAVDKLATKTAEKIAAERPVAPPDAPDSPPSTQSTPVRLATRGPAFSSLPLIREPVHSSFPYPNEADADEDALAVARDVIEQRLAELDPPVYYRPSLTEVKNEFLRRDSRKVRPPDPEERLQLARHGFGPNLVYVEYEVQLLPEQVRSLRTRDRLIDALRVLGAVTAVALVGFLFLRLDEWTRGYLTRWLAVGALALAAGAAVALYLV
jgi:hypothetical protein